VQILASRRSRVLASLATAGVLISSVTAGAIAESAVASAKSLCHSSVAVTKGGDYRLTLSCSGQSIHTVSGTANAYLASIAKTVHGSSGHLTCQLVRKHKHDKTKRFSCAAPKNATVKGTLHVDFDTVADPKCALEINSSVAVVKPHKKNVTTSASYITGKCPKPSPSPKPSSSSSTSPSPSASPSGSASASASASPTSSDPNPGTDYALVLDSHFEEHFDGDLHPQGSLISDHEKLDQDWTLHGESSLVQDPTQVNTASDGPLTYGDGTQTDLPIYGDTQTGSETANGPGGTQTCTFTATDDLTATDGERKLTSYVAALGTANSDGDPNVKLELAPQMSFVEGSGEQWTQTYDYDDEDSCYPESEVDHNDYWGNDYDNAYGSMGLEHYDSTLKKDVVDLGTSSLAAAGLEDDQGDAVTWHDGDDKTMTLADGTVADIDAVLTLSPPLPTFDSDTTPTGQWTDTYYLVHYQQKPMGG
jgi:hypothetical protein